MKLTQQQMINQVKQQMDEIQTWFAARPYGFRDRASAEQMQQYNDRVAEYAYLEAHYEYLTGGR